MRSPTLVQVRWLAVVYLAILLTGVGNHYLGWGITGSADRKVLAAVMFIGLVALARYGSSLQRLLEDHRAAEQRAEAEAERARDKSNDVAETERLRRAIGMPPDNSLERGRDR